MRKWEKVKITDVCDIQVGKTPSRNNSSYWGENNKWLSIADMNQGNYLSLTKEFITKKAIDECHCVLIPTGTVLYSFKLSIGKVGITKVPMFTNEAIAAFIIKDRSRIIEKYLFYALKATDYSIFSNKAVLGKTLNKEKLKQCIIPLPPISEQKRIVTILDKANELIEKRKEAIELLDEYLKSVFLDMFGDPVTNPMNWKQMKFSELGKLDRGISKHRPRNAPELLGGIHPLIQTGEVANADLYINKYTHTYSEIGLKQSKKWPAGTLCITIAANIAKTGILAFDSCFPDSIVGFIPDEKVTNTIFIHFWLSFLQKILEDSAPESAQKNINLQILRNLDVIVPPIQNQIDFSNKVKNCYLLKKRMEDQLIELERNFQVLLTNTFQN